MLMLKSGRLSSLQGGDSVSTAWSLLLDTLAVEEGQWFGCPGSLKSFDLLQEEPITVTLQRGLKTSRETVRAVPYPTLTNTCTHADTHVHAHTEASRVTGHSSLWFPILIILCSIPSFELEVLASKNEVKGNIP